MGSREEVGREEVAGAFVAGRGARTLRAEVDDRGDRKSPPFRIETRNPSHLYLDNAERNVKVDTQQGKANTQLSSNFPGAFPSQLKTLLLAPISGPVTLTYPYAIAV